MKTRTSILLPFSAFLRLCGKFFPIPTSEFILSHACHIFHAFSRCFQGWMAKITLYQSNTYSHKLAFFHGFSKKKRFCGSLCPNCVQFVTGSGHECDTNHTQTTLFQCTLWPDSHTVPQRTNNSFFKDLSAII